MLCRNCHEEYPDNFRFCPECGTDLVDDGSSSDEELARPIAAAIKQYFLPWFSYKAIKPLLAFWRSFMI